MMTKITVEDKGQDVLWFKINNAGIVEEAGPFQKEVWKGAYIPYWDVYVGQPLPIHLPPYITHGFLKYKVTSVKRIEQ